MKTIKNTGNVTVKITADSADQFRKTVVELAQAVGADNVRQIEHKSDFLEGYVSIAPRRQDEVPIGATLH